MEIEKEIFDFTVNEGRIKLKYPQYWDVDNIGQVQVFLRIE